MNCPICDKIGLPDYRNIPTVCPQCDSDLSSFSYIQKIKNSANNNSYRKLIFTIVALCLCFVFIYHFFPRIITKTIEVKIVSKNDSIANLKSVILDLKQKQINEKADIVKYIVKQNDNLEKISKKYFDDYLHIQKIAKDNNIQNPNLIEIGEVLFIELNEKK